MKKSGFFTKVLSMIAVGVMASTSAFAAGGSGISGISDLTLLYLLITFGVLMLIVVFVLSNIIKGLASNREIWNYLKSKNAASLLLLLGGVGLASPAMAQESTAVSSSFIMSDSLFWGLMLIDVFLVVVVFYLFTVLKNLIATMRSSQEEVAEPSVADTWAAALTDSVPLEQEEEIMTDHEYDGIRELDNNLPPWWVMGFYVTIIFAFGYLIYYHVMDGPSSKQEYIAAMTAAEEKQEAYTESMANAIDESNVVLVTDAGKLEKGKAVFTSVCAACHGQAGEGGVGPNLTDKYWIHGGGISDVFKTIKYGVPAKGMISWESQLSPEQMQNVSSFILSLQGTNPPNGKEPQGELWEPKEEAPEEEVAPADSSATADEDEPEMAMK